MNYQIIIVCIIMSAWMTGLNAQDDTISIEAVSVEAYHVSYQLRSIPGSLSVISAGNLATNDLTSLNALNSVPGVNMQSGTFTTNRIIIRGMGSRTPYNTNRIRSYLNEIPLTTSDGLSSPEEIDVTYIGRLEIIKGPSSALYGSGLGGNINLYTPTVTKNSISAGMQYGSYATLKPFFSASLVKGPNTIFAGLNHLHSDGWRENSKYDRTSFLINASRNNDKWRTDLLLLALAVNSGLPSSIGKTLFETNPESAAVNWKAIEGYKKYTRLIAGITLTGRISESITNKLSVFARGIDSYERRPFNNLDDHSVSAGFRNRINIHGTRTDLVLGLEYIADQYSWKLDTNSYLINNNRENRSQFNLFGMAYYRPVTGLNLSFAAALNHVSYKLTDRFPQNGDNDGNRSFPLIFSPRLGINYLVRSHWAIYASAGHGFSMPSPEETLLPEGNVNPEIRHEEGWQAEIGSRYSVSDRLAMDITLYWIELENLLVTKRLTEDIFTGINAGRTRHGGLELLIHSRLLKLANFPGNLETDVSYTYAANKFVSFTDDGISYDGYKLPGIPEQVVYLKMLWTPLNNAQLITDFRYTGPQYLNDQNTLNIQGYFLMNIKLSVDFKFSSRILSAYAGVNNATNTAYASMLLVNARGFGGNEPRYYYPGMPRNYYAGISYRF